MQLKDHSNLWDAGRQASLPLDLANRAVIIQKLSLKYDSPIFP